MRTNPRPLKTSRWAALRLHVALRASFRCEHCHVFLGTSGQADHVVPRSHCENVGIGVFDPSNLQYLCSSCHSQKSNRERWAGHEKRGPKKMGTRSTVQGREAFQKAAGITPQQKEIQC